MRTNARCLRRGDQGSRTSMIATVEGNGEERRTGARREYYALWVNGLELGARYGRLRGTKARIEEPCEATPTEGARRGRRR